MCIRDRGNAFAEGGAAGVAVSAQRDRAVADDGAELAVRSAGGLGRVGTADRPAVKAVWTTHSGRRGRVHLQALQGAVAAGLVGGAVLPAVPDHVEPGSGQDADGVRVVVAPADGVAVELVRPGVRVPAVSGEVADRVAQLFVGRPAEAHRLDLAGLAGGGGDPGQAGQRFRGGEASPACLLYTSPSPRDS